MKFSKLALPLFVLTVMFSSVKTTARSLDAVYDKEMDFVIDFRGNCVRTKWEKETDPCAKPEELKVEDVPPQYIDRQVKTTYVDIVRQSIYFPIDVDSLDASSEQRIEEVINEINKSIAMRNVKLVGYADRFATNKYNMDLSKRRAENVLNYIHGRGYLNNTDIGFGYYGEEKPVTNCPENVSVTEQIACLQTDRRVDIEIELMREKVETVRELVNKVYVSPPAYPRQGTTSVETYSTPVSPSVEVTEPAPQALDYYQVPGGSSKIDSLDYRPQSLRQIDPLDFRVAPPSFDYGSETQSIDVLKN